MSRSLNKPLKILFISRSFPPVTGGIENHNHAIAQWLPKYADTKILANRFGKIFLPLFLPYATLYALVTMRRRDTLLLGDGVLGIVGWIVKQVYKDRRRVVCVVHGLDLTYDLALYQKLWVTHFIPACDRLIAVSRQTVSAGTSRGIDESLFITIPNGVDTDSFTPADASRHAIDQHLQTDTAGKQVLLSCGRLVKRKGVGWFIRNVMPGLPDDVIYVVCGAGPDKEDIELSIEQKDMAARIYLLGYVSDRDYRLLLNSCDVFIQPNIPVAGDMEGFGLVVLEAGSAGVPVVASNLEGLKDAIKHNENGILVESEDAGQFHQAILDLLSDAEVRKKLGTRARKFNLENFHWSIVTQQYADACRDWDQQSA